MYAVISHNILSNNNTNSYTFKYEGDRKVGDLMVCRTRRGNSLGKIVGFVNEADAIITPAEAAVKLNAGRRRSLSSFDRAKLRYLETKDASAALAEFNPYNGEERRAMIAWAYSILDATRVRFYSDICEGMYVYIYNYEEDEEYVINHVF